ncbi:MAG TPA: PEP-CTERM sorting domain-containing protein [Rhodocyclaceae bacterium]|nr:PEP-CTERM sorting domain-containing protein [Rhodocyclaceae bacterium]
MSKTLRSIMLPLATAFAALGAGQAMAAATIINPAGNVAIGVDDLGQLNTYVGNVAVNSGYTGVSYKFADGYFRDATSPGCLCEGWGVSANNAVSGYANNSSGTGNLTQTSFTSTASTATVTTALTSMPGLTVTHDFAPATNAGNALYRVHVTISNNTGAAMNDVKYVRVMDWDVPPTEFNEYVTIRGTGTTTLLEESHDNGFNTADPLGGSYAIDGSTLNVDFADNGPNDHGAYFRFNFGTLADGESYSFDIFYGAADTEAAALAAIGAESIELYSLGQSYGGEGTGSPATFIFGFRGVGGVSVEPNPIPEPGSLALAGLALAGLWGSRRRTIKSM